MANGRCPYSKLTVLQVRALANACLGSEIMMPAGVYRSLVCRGLLTGRHEMTTEGCEALDRCELLSPAFRQALIERARTCVERF